MPLNLPSRIHPGIVNTAGKTPETQKLTEELLERDRQQHHSVYHHAFLHNHCSHQYVAELESETI